MKNIRSTVLLLILLTIFSSTVFVNAEDSEVDTQETKEYITDRQETKEHRKEVLEERKEARKKFMDTQKEKREEEKENMKAFREESGTAKDAFNNLSDEEKKEVKVLKNNKEESINEVKEQLKDNDLTIEEREELRIKIKEINEQNIEQLKEKFINNEEAISWINEREKLKAKNQELRDQAKIDREKYRGERSESIEVEKEYYLNKLSTAIPKVSDKGLERISKKAKDMVEKVEENNKIDDEKKDKLISKIVALIEILDEELENRNINDEEIDLSEIISQ